MKKDQHIAFMTTKEIKEKLQKIAEEEDRTLSYIVHRILSIYFSDSYKK